MKAKSIALLALLAATVAAQAQVVGADTQPRYKDSAPVKDIPTYRPVENLLIFEGGVLPNLTVAYGRQMSRYMMVAGGVGFVTGNDYEGLRETVPVFGELRLSTPKYRFGFFADAKVGVDLIALFGGTSSREYLRALPVASVLVGVAARHFSLGIGINTMWSWFHYSNVYWNGSDYVSYDEYDAEYRIGPMITLQYGLPTASIKKALF